MPKGGLPKKSKPSRPASVQVPVTVQKEKMVLEQVKSKWPEILAKVKPLNHSIEALLRSSRPIKAEEEMITLEVFYRFHKERLEAEKCRQVVETVASQILNRPIHLRYVLG